MENFVEPMTTITTVLVLYTGGTIGMKPTKTGLRPAKREMYTFLENSGLTNRKIRPSGIPPEYLLITKGHNIYIAYHLVEYTPLLDSSNMNQTDWIRIAKDIGENFSKFNGFVVLTGTDTLAFIASALSFTLENLNKPVVVTGSQLPIYDIRTDGFRNLINSLLFAGSRSDVHEVVVVFDNSVMRGNRVVKVDNHGFAAFISPNAPKLAKLEPVIKHNNGRSIRMNDHKAFSVFASLSTNITILYIYPCIQADLVREMLKNVKGAVLVTFGNGNVPSNNKELINALYDAVQRKVLIVNVTQCLQGSVSYDYEAGAVLQDIGVVPGYDMTLPAAFTKLAYVLSQDIDFNDKKELMETNIRGELSNNEE